VQGALDLRHMMERGHVSTMSWRSLEKCIKVLEWEWRVNHIFGRESVCMHLRVQEV
jgi:hypothetical protein